MTGRQSWDEVKAARVQPGADLGGRARRMQRAPAARQPPMPGMAWSVRCRSNQECRAAMSVGSLLE
jgi:hypothetical protein